jgi:hypothetical protein
MTRAYLTRYGPPTGFLTLLTACSPAARRALFHAQALMGLPPFRAFPSGRAVAPLGTRSPHGVGDASSRGFGEEGVIVRYALPRDQSQSAWAKGGSSSPPSGRSTRRGVRCPPQGKAEQRTRCSRGVVGLFRVLRSPDLGPTFPTALLPWACSPRPPSRSEERPGDRGDGPPECHSIRLRTRLLSAARRPS